MTVLLTGAAGFIGYHVAATLLAAGRRVVGVDCLTDDYDPQLKRVRLHRLHQEEGFECHAIDILDAQALTQLCDATRPDAVVHLAARAGVRASVDEPASYTEVNALGFARVLEAAHRASAGRVIYASSSSVYGDTAIRPTPETAPCILPRSPYASTKLANELLAAAVGRPELPCLGLRLFTAYGPWGRPDMASHHFLEALRTGAPIRLNNHGEMGRDWVYVEDIARVVSHALQASLEPHDVWNVGSGTCTTLGTFVDTLEALTGRRADRHLAPLPEGDVGYTQADLTRLVARGAPAPATSLRDGLAAFVRWHESYYGAP